MTEKKKPVRKNRTTQKPEKCECPYCALYDERDVLKKQNAKLRALKKILTRKIKENHEHRNY